MVYYLILIRECDYIPSSPLSFYIRDMESRRFSCLLYFTLKSLLFASRKQSLIPPAKNRQ